MGREDVHRKIKPQILSSFGDVALVIGDKFEKYLEAVLRVLKQAMGLSITSAAAAGVYQGILGRGIWGDAAGGHCDLLPTLLDTLIATPP